MEESLGSIFDQPAEPASGETDVDDGMDALADEMLLALERGDRAALAGILRSLKGS